MRSEHLELEPRCRACTANEHLQIPITSKHLHIHHLIYRGYEKRGEKEKPGDLVTLCEKHHDELHSIFGTSLQTQKQKQEQKLWITKTAAKARAKKTNKPAKKTNKPAKTAAKVSSRRMCVTCKREILRKHREKKNKNEQWVHATGCPKKTT